MTTLIFFLITHLLLLLFFFYHSLPPNPPLFASTSHYQYLSLPLSLKAHDSDDGSHDSDDGSHDGDYYSDVDDGNAGLMVIVRTIMKILLIQIMIKVTKMVVAMVTNDGDSDDGD